MILVLLGTQKNEFNRLLEAIEKNIVEGNIKEKVIVQAGCTKYSTDLMEIFDLIPKEDIEELKKKARIIITHGGVGSILSCVKLGKKVIAVPRLAKYNEHVNDHQKQLVEKFDKEGYIIGVEDLEKLPEALKRIEDFEPRKYISNTNNFINLIENYIDNNQKNNLIVA